MRCYVHAVDGRIRIKIPYLQQQPYRCRKLQQALLDCEGIESVETSALTGSVVIHYDPDVVEDVQIFNILKYNGYLNDCAVTSTDEYHASGAVKAGQALGKACFSWAVGRALNASGLSFLSALI
jgi:hypothetical protein